MGAGERRADLLPARGAAPLRDSVCGAREAGRGVSRDQARARRLQPARGRDPPLAALLQHGGGNGKGYRGARRPDLVLLLCAYLSTTPATRTLPRTPAR